MFLVFEGADGTGKSTQTNLLAEYLRNQRKCRVDIVREPGGTNLGEKVREILLDPVTGDLEPQTELFLFMAARSHLVSERILPAMRRGTVVVCDRFVWSSVVYQGIVGGLGIQQVFRIGRLATSALPTRVFILDIPSSLAYRRLGRKDRMEERGPDFQEQVRRGFLDLARRYPQKVVVIDGRGSARSVHKRVIQQLPERGWSSCRQ